MAQAFIAKQRQNGLQSLETIFAIIEIQGSHHGR
jgi:hypothetical protein